MFGFLTKPSPAKFAKLVLHGIKAAGGPEFDYDPVEFEIRRGKTRGFLGNTYAAYCSARGAHRAAILQNFVAAFSQARGAADLSYDEASSKLVTVVRERALFSLSALKWQVDRIDQTPKEVTEPMSRWFVKTLVIDAPGFMALVNEEQVANWKLPEPELFATGQQHLCAMTAPKFTGSNGVFRGQWNDDYDSSRVLVPGLFAGLAIAGDPVIAIPNRLTLLVTGSNNVDAIRRLLQTAEEITRTQPRAQNPAPLVLRDGILGDFRVETDSPVFNDVERAHRIAALQYYEEQKGRLEELYQKEGKDYFVGSYTLTRLPDGTYRSYAAWTKGVPTLLPIVDEILLMDLDRPEKDQCVARVPWARLTECVPDLLLDTKMFPERYFVGAFPTADQIRAFA